MDTMDQYGLYHLSGPTSPHAVDSAGQSPEWRDDFLEMTDGIFDHPMGPGPWSKDAAMSIDQPTASGSWTNGIAVDDQMVDPELFAAFKEESTPENSYVLPLTPISPSPPRADAPGTGIKPDSVRAPLIPGQVKVKVEKAGTQSKKPSVSSSKVSKPTTARQPETNKEEKLRKNREAASKSRVKKKSAEQKLEQHAESMAERNEQLRRQYNAVKGELNDLQDVVLNHASTCTDPERRARLVSAFESHRDRVASGLGNLVRVSQSPNDTP